MNIHPHPFNPDGPSVADAYPSDSYSAAVPTLRSAGSYLSLGDQHQHHQHTADPNHRNSGASFGSRWTPSPVNSSSSAQPHTNTNMSTSAATGGALGTDAGAAAYGGSHSFSHTHGTHSTMRPAPSSTTKPRTPIGALVKNLFWTPHEQHSQLHSSNNNNNRSSVSSFTQQQQQQSHRPASVFSLGPYPLGTEPHPQPFQVFTATVPNYNDTHAAALASAFETPAFPPAQLPAKLDANTARLIGIRDRLEDYDDNQLGKILFKENAHKKEDGSCRIQAEGWYADTGNTAVKWAGELPQSRDEFEETDGLVGPYDTGSVIEATPPLRPLPTLEDYQKIRENRDNPDRSLNSRSNSEKRAKKTVSELPPVKHPFAAKPRSQSYDEGPLSDHMSNGAGLKSFFGDGAVPADVDQPEMPSSERASSHLAKSMAESKGSRKVRQKKKGGKRSLSGSQASRAGLKEQPSVIATQSRHVTDYSKEDVRSPASALRMEDARAAALAKLEAKTANRSAVVMGLDPNRNSTSPEGANDTRDSSTPNKTLTTGAGTKRQTMDTMQTQSTASFGHILHANGAPLPINLQQQANNPSLLLGSKNGASSGIGVPPGATAPRMFPRRPSGANGAATDRNPSPLPNISERSEHTKVSLYSEQRQPSEKLGPQHSARVSTVTDAEEQAYPGRSPGLPPLSFQQEPQPSLLDILNHATAEQNFFVTQDGTVKLGQPLSQALEALHPTTPGLGGAGSARAPSRAETSRSAPPRQDSGDHDTVYRAPTAVPSSNALGDDEFSTNFVGGQAAASAKSKARTEDEWTIVPGTKDHSAFLPVKGATSYAASDATDEATVRAVSPGRQYSELRVGSSIAPDLQHEDPALRGLRNDMGRRDSEKNNNRMSVLSSRTTMTATQVEAMLQTTGFHDEVLCQYLDAAKLSLIGEQAKKALIRAARARIIELRDMRDKGIPIGPNTQPLVIDKKRRSEKKESSGEDGRRRVSERTERHRDRENRKVSGKTDRKVSASREERDRLREERREERDRERELKVERQKEREREKEERRLEREREHELKVERRDDRREERYLERQRREEEHHARHAKQRAAKSSSSPSEQSEREAEPPMSETETSADANVRDLTRLLSKLIPKDQVGGAFGELIRMEQQGSTNQLTDELIDRIEDQLFEPLPRTPLGVVAPGAQLPSMPPIVPPPPVPLGPVYASNLPPMSGPLLMQPPPMLPMGAPMGPPPMGPPPMIPQMGAMGTPMGRQGGNMGYPGGVVGGIYPPVPPAPMYSPNLPYQANQQQFPPPQQFAQPPPLFQQQNSGQFQGPVYVPPPAMQNGPPPLPPTNGFDARYTDGARSGRSRALSSDAPLTTEAALSIAQGRSALLDSDFGDDYDALNNPTGTLNTSAVLTYTGFPIGERFKHPLLVLNPDQPEGSIHTINTEREAEIHAPPSEHTAAAATPKAPAASVRVDDAWVDRAATPVSGAAGAGTAARSARSAAMSQESWGGPMINVHPPTAQHSARPTPQATTATPSTAPSQHHQQHRPITPVSAVNTNHSNHTNNSTSRSRPVTPSHRPVTPSAPSAPTEVPRSPSPNAWDHFDYYPAPNLDLNRDLPPLPPSESAYYTHSQVTSHTHTQARSQQPSRQTSRQPSRQPSQQDLHGRHSEDAASEAYLHEDEDDYSPHPDDDEHEYITPHTALGESEHGLSFESFHESFNMDALSRSQSTTPYDEQQHQRAAMYDPSMFGSSLAGGGTAAGDEFTPWDRVAQRLYSWAMLWDENMFTRTMGKMSVGSQLDAFPITVFLMMTFKRNLQHRLEQTPPQVCDKLLVPPNMADNINLMVHAGRYDDAKRVLVDLWWTMSAGTNPSGEVKPPRVVIAVVQHGTEKGAWMANRYDLGTHKCTSYIVTHQGIPARPEIDGRPFMWWHAIRRAWPSAHVPDPNEMAQVLKPTVLPREFAEEVSLRAAVIGRNLLLGIRPDHEHDRVKIRDHIWEEIKRLLLKKRMGKLLVQPERKRVTQ